MIAAFTGSVFLGLGVAAAGTCLGLRGTGRQGSRELWWGAAAAATPKPRKTEPVNAAIIG